MRSWPPTSNSMTRNTAGEYYCLMVDCTVSRTKLYSDTNAGYVLTDCAESECKLVHYALGDTPKAYRGHIACAVYGDCSGPETALPVPEYPPPLQAGWSVDMPCAVDNPQRVLANVIVSYLPSTTPYSCTGLCGSKGYQYAGVEYGDECYCGTGYVDNVMPPAANLSDCSMLCAGGYYFNCGGSWRMQIYKFN